MIREITSMMHMIKINVFERKFTAYFDSCKPQKTKGQFNFSTQFLFNKKKNNS